MVKQSEISARLAGRSPLFSSLDEEAVNGFLKDVPLVAFEAAKLVIREGDPGESMYLIRSGMVRVSTTRDDREVELAVLGPGACVGEVGAITGTPRTASVITMEPSELYCFSRRQINELLNAYPRVKKRLEALVIGRAKDTIDKISGG